MKFAVNKRAVRGNCSFAGSSMMFSRQVLRCLRTTLILVAPVLLGAMSAQATTFFQVTTTADNGNNTSPTAGSLRKAIVDANTTPGNDVIQFNIPGAGVHTISPIVPLPVITETVLIDGL